MLTRECDQARPGAIDATALLAQEFGFAPTLTSDCWGWTDVRLCKWKGRAATVRYPAFEEVVLVLYSGRCQLVAPRSDHWRDRECRHGQITVIPPGTPLDWRVFGDVEGWTLQLPSRCFDGLSDEVPGDRLVQRVIFEYGCHDPLLRATIDSLANELKQPLGYGLQYVAALADTIKLHLLRRSGAFANAPLAGLPRAVLNRVLDRIEDALERGVSLDELARLAGRGRTQFAAAFRTSMGCPPLEYLRRRRMDQARIRLAHGSESLLEIALSLGFASQAHFSASFRAAVGMTPSRFRMAAS